MEIDVLTEWVNDSFLRSTINQSTFSNHLNTKAMFLQTSMTSRRNFLERSMLGFGSAFLLPSLLQSCIQDHNIPGPGQPLDSPLLGDGVGIDWNDDAKTMVTSAIEMIPGAGDLLGGLVSILWPDFSNPLSVWDTIRAQVEALIKKELDQQIYYTVSGNLKGLANVLSDYTSELTTGSPDDIKQKWSIALGDFEIFQPNFQTTGSELLLLPLFGQFANLYLTLLRDGVTHGASWNMTSDDISKYTLILQNKITEFYNYALNTYFAGRQTLQQNTQRDDGACEPFLTVNAYDRQMSQTVLYFMDIWPFFDVTQFPNGTAAAGIYRREIYSDPFGSVVNSGEIVITTPIPTQFPTNLTVWGYDRIDAVQLTYPAGSGPGAVTTTPRMGDANGGTNQPPKGGSFNQSPDNPITQARVQYGYYELFTGEVYGPVVSAMQFGYNDKTTTNLMGGLNGVWNNHYIDTNLFGYPNQALSSIHINGINKNIGSADCVVFGFQSWTSLTVKLKTIQTIYVTSPKERSAADFAKEFPKLAIPANLITDELRAARKAYWERIKARPK